MATEKRPKISNEEKELEEAFRLATNTSEPAGPSGGYRGQSTKKKAGKARAAGSGDRKRTALIACCAFLLVVLAACGIWAYFLSTGGGDSLISGNVSAGGIDLSGKTRDEAVELLNRELAPQYAQDMVIALPGGELHITPEEAGVSLDVEAMVENAFAQGSQGSPCQLDPLDYLSLDTAAIRTVLDEAVSQYHAEPTASSVTVTGEYPSLTDQDEAPQVLVITIGQHGVTLDIEALYADILEGYREGIFRLEPETVCTDPEKPDLQAVYDELYAAPANAACELVDGQWVIRSGSYGYEFDLDAAQAEIDAAGYGDVIEVTMSYTEPDILELFQDQLATCDTVQRSSSANRNTNLALAAKALNGTIVMPGEVFSYNQVLGERTTEKGYKPATAYSGGQVVQSVGGGICQGASALYYCTLIADFEIIERKNHTYDASYVPLGMDAAINWGTQDLKFRNNTDYPIRIDAYAYAGGFCVTLMGTETKDYYVEMEYEIISQQAPKIEYKVMDYNNPEGYRDGTVLSNGHYAYQIKTYKCKYDISTKEQISRTYEASSTYRSYPKTVVQIDPATIPGATQPSEPTTPPETEPPETTVPETEPPETTVPETTAPEPEAPDPAEPGENP